jgi:hypothetical protein
MKLFLLTIFLVVPALASTQHNITVTGCLTKDSHSEYVLVDQKGTTYLLYSSTVNLSSYVGQSVSLNGDRSATPSTDTGTA